ncbi:MAG: hypothetical protein ABIN68_02820 [Sphingomicrobium sp.]
MIGGLFFVALSIFLFWMGWRHWRYRDEDTISLLEAGILKATGEEPMPSTRTDRVLSRVQAIFGFLLGPFFIFVGLVAILVELDLV